MTTVEEALVTYLKANTTLASKIGDRIYSQHVPQSSILPCVVYQRISSNRVLTHDQSSSGLVQAVYQFDVYSTTYLNALEVADALRGALQGYKGTLSGINVLAILPKNEIHSEEREIGITRIMIEYNVDYQEV